MAALSALDVATELRKRLPGVGAKKLHKLLYYCQGHHLAAFGQPLFRETISAWDMGPVVGQLWNFERRGIAPTKPPTPLGEAEMNTVGYVLSRYGALTGTDLEHLTHSEDPWREADAKREPGTSARIDRGTMQAYFERAVSDEEDDMPLLDKATLTEFFAGVEERLVESVEQDDIEGLRTRLTGAA